MLSVDWSVRILAIQALQKHDHTPNRDVSSFSFLTCKVVVYAAPRQIIVYAVVAHRSLPYSVAIIWRDRLPFLRSVNRDNFAGAQSVRPGNNIVEEVAIE